MDDLILFLMAYCVSLFVTEILNQKLYEEENGAMNEEVKYIIETNESDLEISSDNLYRKSRFRLIAHPPVIIDCYF